MASVLMMVNAQGHPILNAAGQFLTVGGTTITPPVVTNDWVGFARPTAGTPLGMGDGSGFTLPTDTTLKTLADYYVPQEGKIYRWNTGTSAFDLNSTPGNAVVTTPAGRYTIICAKDQLDASGGYPNAFRAARSVITKGWDIDSGTGLGGLAFGLDGQFDGTAPQQITPTNWKGIRTTQKWLLEGCAFDYYNNIQDDNGTKLHISNGINFSNRKYTNAGTATAEKLADQQSCFSIFRCNFRGLGGRYAKVAGGASYDAWHGDCMQTNNGWKGKFQTYCISPTAQYQGAFHGNNNDRTGVLSGSGNAGIPMPYQDEDGGFWHKHETWSLDDRYSVGDDAWEDNHPYFCFWMLDPGQHPSPDAFVNWFFEEVYFDITGMPVDAKGFPAKKTTGTPKYDFTKSLISSWAYITRVNDASGNFIGVKQKTGQTYNSNQSGGTTTTALPQVLKPLNNTTGNDYFRIGRPNIRKNTHAPLDLVGQNYTTVD